MKSLITTCLVFTIFWDTNLLASAVHDCAQHEQLLQMRKRASQPQRSLRSKSLSGLADYKVQILYIVPSDAQERPDWPELLASMGEAIQDYFYDKLGSSFTFANPPVELFHAPYTTYEILKGRMLEHPTSNQSLNMNDYFVEVVLEHYAEEYHSKKTVFLGVSEINLWSAWGAAGLGHIGGVELSRWARGRPSYALQTPAHELGHAFGLAHVANTANCVRKAGIDPDPYDSIMRYYADYRSLSSRPIMFFESDLLLDPDYEASHCLLTIGDRPHPSLYFGAEQRCEAHPDINADKVVDTADLSLVLAAWGDCAPLAGLRADACRQADLDCDGAVGISDLSLLLSQWAVVEGG